MAEAHSAVTFTFTVNHDGEIDINLNPFLLRAVCHLLANSIRRRITKFRNGFHNDVYPLKPIQWVVLTTLLMALSFFGFDFSYGAIDYLMKSRPFLYLDEFNRRFLTAVLVSAVTLYAATRLIRLMFKCLLSYKGWMNDEFGKISLFNKIYLKTVQFLSKRGPLLLGLQGSLPNLPVPRLDDTIKRYLVSARPLLNDAEFDEMKKLADDFRNSIGPKLQRLVWLKWLTSTNYVSDWWEKYVYLKGRTPIMVYSNYYGTDFINMVPTHIQAARAANLAHFCLKYKCLLEHQQVKPVYAGNCIPLCSWQYERTFNTARVPGEEIDEIVHYETSRHIVVHHRGRFFKVVVFDGSRLLEACELERIFQAILDDPSKPADGEMHLAALTAGSRIPWAKARKQYFSEGVNFLSLRDIEKAAIVVAFDDEEYGYDKNDFTKLDRTAKAMLHGKCYDRWFDKSYTLVIGKNGVAGFNAEHTWADAPIVVQMWEYMMSHDCLVVKYAPDGHCVGYSENKAQGVVRLPIRLQWNLVPALRDVIEASLKEAQALAENVQLHLVPHSAFGKGFIKKCKLSPDAFLQMALQLASYRDQGRFWLTYEASMTRFYKEGRTETVRSCSVQSCDWVRSMDDSSKTNEQRIELLRKACLNHQDLYKAAMTGKGVDRHLFTLYVVSRWLEVESPFLKKVLSEPWRLSTSQTPIWQTDVVDVRKFTDIVSCGGGFGPVADDGYGISYVFNFDNHITFHISSMRSCQKTDSIRMGENIVRAMADMKKLFEQQ